MEGRPRGEVRLVNIEEKGPVTDLLKKKRGADKTAGAEATDTRHVQGATRRPGRLRPREQDWEETGSSAGHDKDISFSLNEMKALGAFENTRAVM